ncbi:probable serine/threonine-protein kinase PBL3 isoform X2 [Euphorbia lathyris]|uniref:probable serine/threonine-protein kinase PBL3 isoform X2 n=1 Tax=Euphorbia lathyris TaxID=212925 RepID=UPI0033135D7F
MGNYCYGKHRNQIDPSPSPSPSPSDKVQHSAAVSSTKVEVEIEKKTIKKSDGEMIYLTNSKSFTLVELNNATRNFNPENLIGEGGFGCVYKGWMDEQTLTPTRPGNGITVAIKKLKTNGLQGHKEWLSELNHLGQLHHPNLVKLIGYCLDGENRLLVYEYMPKSSLENHLFTSVSSALCWEIRIKVGVEAARGLSFLHNSQQQVIFRDFKSSNILLDSEFNAKLSDFGLAKAGPTGDRTHVSTRVLGTEGYTAPEYLATGKLTARCDVYSFGVVLLELLTGRRALDKTKVGVEQKLVDWAKPYLGDKRRLFRIMDINLQGRYPLKEAYLVAHLACHCIGEVKVRPQIDEILAILELLPLSKSKTKLSTQQFLLDPYSFCPLRYKDCTSNSRHSSLSKPINSNSKPS